MPLPRFQFSGSWTNPADFPTHESSEAQVRADLMRLFTEIETYLNRTLLPLLESGGYSDSGASGGTGGTSGGTGGGSGASGNYLPKSGGQMTGPLLLAQNPVQLTEAATKAYVDEKSVLVREGTGGAVTSLTVGLDQMQALSGDGQDNAAQSSLTPAGMETVIQNDASQILSLLHQASLRRIQFQEAGRTSGLEMNGSQFRLWFQNTAGKSAELTVSNGQVRVQLQDPAEGTAASFSITPEGISSDPNAIRLQVIDALNHDSSVLAVLRGLIQAQVSGSGGSASLSLTDTDLRAVVLGPDGDTSSVALTQGGIYSTVQSHTGQIASLNTTAEQIQAAVTGVDGRVGALSVRADGIDATVRGQGDTISSISQRANTLESTVGTVQSNIQTMQGQYTSIRQTIDNISLSAVRDGRFARITLQVGENRQVGEILMDGNVTVSGQLSAEALYAARGEVARLSVDQLSTSRRITRYLNRDTSDDNYIRICTLTDGTPVLQFVAGHYDNASEQARTPDGHLLYWDGDIQGYTVGADGYPIVNGSRVYTTTTPGSPPVPVTVYRYREEVKMSLNFQDVDNVYTPVANFGAGNAQGFNRGYIVKGTEGFDLKYISNNNGREVGIRMTTDGFVDITGLRRVSAMNFSGWDSGSFSVAMEGRSTPTGYSVAFDSQNRPISISDSSGFRTTIQW